MTDAAEGTDPDDAPTLELREALAAAGCGRVARAGDAWAVRAPDGTPCTVQLVPDGVRRDELDERLRALRRVDHPHVARIEIVVEAGGRVAIVLRGARGPTLAEALVRREPLGGREAVALAVAVAQGLVAVHRVGQVHGPLAPDDIVIDAEGRAHLRPCVHPAPQGAARHDDVRALARLVADVLDDQVGEDTSGDVFAARAVHEAAQVRTVLLDVIASAAPIEAGTFAALVAATVEAEPIRVPDLAALAARALADTATRRAGGAASAERTAPIAIDGGPRSERTSSGRTVTGVVRRPVRAAAGPSGASQADASRGPRPDDALSRARRAASDGRRVHGRRRARQRWTATAGAVVLVAGVGAVVAAARVETKAVVPAAATAPAVSNDAVLDPTRPEDAARELTLRREQMLAGVARADDVTVAGSPARAADDALVAAIAARGRLRSVPNVRIAAARAVVDPTSGGSTMSQVRVDVTYAVDATTLTTAAGDAEPVMPVASRTDRLDLVWTTIGWRVRAVE